MEFEKGGAGFGLAVGIVMALILTLLLVVVVILGAVTGEPYDWTEVLKQLAFCFFAFPSGGFIIGGLYHLGKSWPGALFAGLAGASVPSFAASILVNGLNNPFSRDTLEVAGICTLAFGVSAAVAIRTVAARRKG